MQQPIELRIVVEGDSEEGFVKAVIIRHLGSLGLHCMVQTVITRRPNDGPKNTGGGNWSKWKEHIHLLLRDKRPNIRVTTLFDLYGLPADFPEPKPDTKGPRIDQLEQAMAESIGDQRFLPYLQRHEFEALVLAALPELKNILGSREDRLGLKELMADISGLAPEDVNEGPNTAPSKRLARFIPSYAPRERKNFKRPVGKSHYGPLATGKAGLAKLREQCPRFNAWITLLESLA